MTLSGPGDLNRPHFYDDFPPPPNKFTMFQQDRIDQYNDFESSKEGDNLVLKKNVEYCNGPGHLIMTFDPCGCPVKNGIKTKRGWI